MDKWPLRAASALRSTVHPAPETRSSACATSMKPLLAAQSRHAMSMAGVSAAEGPPRRGWAPAPAGDTGTGGRQAGPRNLARLVKPQIDSGL